MRVPLVAWTITDDGQHQLRELPIVSVQKARVVQGGDSLRSLVVVRTAPLSFYG